MNHVTMRQGDIWLLESPDAKARPALVLTRQAALDGGIEGITIARVTSNIRSGVTRLPLGVDDGLVRDCVANFDDMAVVRRKMLTARIGEIDPRRHHELCGAFRALAEC